MRTFAKPNYSGATAATRAKSVTRTGGPLLQRQSDSGSEITLDTGDLSKALGRRLPSRAASTGAPHATPCLTRDACTNAEGAGATSEEVDKNVAKNAAQRAKDPKVKRARGDFRMAAELQSFLDAEAPNLLRVVKGIIVNPDLTGAAQQTDCSNKKPVGDPTASCIEVPVEIEAEAKSYNAGATQVGKFGRGRWREFALLVLTHEEAHARFEKEPLPGLMASSTAGGPDSLVAKAHFELNEVNSILSEMPAGFRGSQVGVATPEEAAQVFRGFVRNRVTQGKESLSKTLTQLRCLLPCEMVDNNVRIVFDARAAEWPAELRTMVLRILNEPDLKLDWPVKPLTPDLRVVPAAPDAKERQQVIEEVAIQRNGNGSSAEPTSVPPIVLDVLNGQGAPLDTDAKSFMESRFGHQFGEVRIHTNARAADSARAVNANAYTVGRDIVFGSGRYSPQTSEGRRLLAHELTHVLQQRGPQPGSSNLLQKDDVKRPKDAPLDEKAERIVAIVLPNPRDKRDIETKSVELIYRILGTYYPGYASKISGVGFDDKEAGTGVAVKPTRASRTKPWNGFIYVGHKVIDLLIARKSSFAALVAMVGHELEHVDQWRSGLEPGTRDNDKFRDQREFLAHAHEAMFVEPEGTGRMHHSTRAVHIDAALGYYYCMDEKLQKQYSAQKDELLARRPREARFGHDEKFPNPPSSCKRAPGDVRGEGG